ncbi:MAG: flavin reductase family protein [Candidatus Electryoneaceae bacterium]|nr:flavin reductase family protein [Candidatus Electryoneaceae bacterium]
MKIQIPPSVHSYPAPVILIGCGTIDKPNIITCSWFGTVCSEPPMVSVSIRRNRHSYNPIHISGEFTVNIPQTTDIDIVKYCGTKSGRDVNKFTELGLTPAICPPLRVAPMISECPLVLACKVKHELELGTHNIFIAEVMSIHCEEDRVRKSQRPDTNPEDQVVYLDGKYWTLDHLRE